MGLTHNALPNSNTQKELVSGYEKLIGEQIEFIDVSITFDTKAKSVTVVEDGHETLYPSYAAFRAHIKERRAEAEPAPKAKGKGGKAKAAKVEKAKAAKAAKAPPAEPAPAPRDEAAIKAGTAALEKEIKDLITDISKERTGEITKNEARWSKGGRLDRFEDIAKDLKAAGDDRFSGRSNTALAMARELIDEHFRARNVVESARSRLSPAEVSMTRKIWATYLKYDGGLSATFRIVDAKDPATGNPVTDDSGQPPEAKVVGIAPNKAYAVAEFYAPDDRDKLLSFIHRNSEKAVLAAAKLFAERPGRVSEIIDTLNELAYEAERARVNGESEGLTADEVVLDHIAKERGATPPSTVKSIKVEANLYNGDWTDTKRVATAIAVGTGNRDMLDDKGEIRNTALLEMILGTYFAPRLYGAANLVQLFRASETITEEQATAFLAEYSHGDLPQGEAEAEVEPEEVEPEGIPA